MEAQTPSENSPRSLSVVKKSAERKSRRNESNDFEEEKYRGLINWRKVVYFGYETSSNGSPPWAEHEPAKFSVVLVQFHTNRTLYLNFNQSAGLFGQTARLLPHHLAAALVNLSYELADSTRFGNRLIVENHLSPRHFKSIIQHWTQNRFNKSFTG